MGFCEISEYCQKVLAKNFPQVPIFDDVEKLHPTDVIPRDGRIDLITSGFPCQDLSIAGVQAGIEADRSGLFFQIMRLSDEFYAFSGTRPSLLLENVPNVLAGNGGDWARTIYGELACRGYCVEWKTLGASHVGAPHRRLRWWAIAYMAHADSIRHGRGFDQKRGTRKRNFQQEEQGWSQMGGETQGCSESCGKEKLAHADEQRLERTAGQGVQKGVYGSTRSSQRNPRRSIKPRLGRTLHHGIPPWMDEPLDIPRVTKVNTNRKERLMSLGNSVVPQVAMIPLIRFKEIFYETNPTSKI